MVVRNVITFACGAATILVVTAVVGLGLRVGLPTSLNEIGDALSGFASSLAFIWLVGGYFLQQAELRENRLETQRMRNAMEQQSEYLALEDCAKSVKLYFSALENAAASFESVFAVFAEKWLEIDPKRIGHLHGFGVLAKSLKNLEAKDREFESKISPFVPGLRREICRFHSIVLRVERFLNANPHGERVRDALLRDSVYEDAFKAIERASAQRGLVGQVFQLSDSLA